MDEIINRLTQDIQRIRQSNDRTGKLSERVFRWEGEPHGWRKMGDLADDLEQLLTSLGKA